MRGVRCVGFGLGLLCCACRMAEAQSLSDQVARFALMTTPAGSLVPASNSSIESEVQRHVMAALRYGYLDGQGVQKQTFAATAQVPVAFGLTLSATAGWSQCINCGNSPMLGGSLDWTFWQMPVGLLGEGRRITIGLNGEFGWGEVRGPLASGGSAWTGSFGIPVGLINKSRPFDRWRFVPYALPTFNYGVLDDHRRTLDGTAFMLAAGLAIYKRTSPVGIHVGAQYIAVRDGDITFGVGLVLGLR